MKESPILMSAPMVQAILAGWKTETRRVLKGANHVSAGGIPLNFVGSQIKEVPCPYGWIGDQLWVRETFARDDEDGGLFYRADVGSGNEADDWERNRLDGVARYRWRPSIHMPRAFSRITLIITDVFAERLQDISRGEAMAEGCPFPNIAAGSDPRMWFAGLWDQINGPGSWDTNPWVWVVKFNRAAMSVDPTIPATTTPKVHGWPARSSIAAGA